MYVDHSDDSGQNALYMVDNGDVILFLILESHRR